MNEIFQEIMRKTLEYDVLDKRVAYTVLLNFCFSAPSKLTNTNETVFVVWNTLALCISLLYPGVSTDNYDPQKVFDSNIASKYVNHGSINYCHAFSKAKFMKNQMIDATENNEHIYNLRKIQEQYEFHRCWVRIN